MNCKQFNRIIYNGQIPASLSGEIESHARNCQTCSRELVLEKMTRELLRSYSSDSTELTHWDEVRMINRVKSRLQEMAERNQFSWENSIIAVRGWLVAFGAVALLLLALSGQMAINDSNNRQDQSLSKNTGINPDEEIISVNAAVAWPPIEEPEHVK